MKKAIVGLIIVASLCVSTAPIFAQCVQVKPVGAVVNVAKLSWGSAPVDVAKLSWGMPKPMKLSWG